MNPDKLKSLIPWQAKILAKLILSRIPLPFRVWRRVNLFRHGRMKSANYALDVFRKHCGSMIYDGTLSGRTVLELGPGDSIATGLIAHACGAERTYLVDVGNFVETDLREYRELLSHWEAEGFRFDGLVRCRSFRELCEESATIYLTQGLHSLRKIPSETVDIAFSNTVLQHVRRSEFKETISELLRVLKPEGLSSHTVDLRDCLTGGLNDLRFSDRLWESEIFAKSGFYTNRIRFQEMLGIFRSVGFSVAVDHAWTWHSLPTSRQNLWKKFRDLSDEDLSVSVFEVSLRKRDNT